MLDACLELDSSVWHTGEFTLLAPYALTPAWNLTRDQNCREKRDLRTHIFVMCSCADLQIAVDLEKSNKLTALRFAQTHKS